MVKSIVEIDAEIETRLDDLGFELVAAEWGGSRHRPVLRLRIDRPGSGVGHGVTVADCAVVSRALEPWLDGHARVPDRYVLEVSSPGVDRPLVRPRDFQRFRGARVAVKGKGVLVGRATRLEGELLGLDEGEDEAVRLRLSDGDEVHIPRKDVREVHLVFTWR